MVFLKASNDIPAWANLDVDYKAETFHSKSKAVCVGQVLHKEDRKIASKQDSCSQHTIGNHLAGARMPGTLHQLCVKQPSELGCPCPEPNAQRTVMLTERARPHPHLNSILFFPQACLGTPARLMPWCRLLMALWPSLLAPSQPLEQWGLSAQRCLWQTQRRGASHFQAGC